jgi:hypothetical protein
MESQGEIRLEALKALTVLAIHDNEFRRDVWSDLEGTLTRYGFDLSYQEMEQVRGFRDAVVNSLDEDIYAALAVHRR